MISKFITVQRKTNSELIHRSLISLSLFFILSLILPCFLLLSSCLLSSLLSIFPCLVSSLVSLLSCLVLSLYLLSSLGIFVLSCLSCFIFSCILGLSRLLLSCLLLYSFNFPSLVYPLQSSLLPICLCLPVSVVVEVSLCCVVSCVCCGACVCVVVVRVCARGVVCPFQTPACRLKTCPCARSERLSVYGHQAHMYFNMRAFCQHTRKRFKRTHGHVLNRYTRFCMGTPHRHRTTTHTQHTRTHNTRHLTKIAYIGLSRDPEVHQK